MFGLLGRIRARLAGAAATSPTAVLPSAVKFRLRAVVAEHLGVAEDQLWPAASLAEDLGADSLDLVELAIAVETEFGIAIPEAAIGRVRTYGDLAQATVDLACRKDAPSLGREVETASNGDGAPAAGPARAERAAARRARDRRAAAGDSRAGGGPCPAAERPAPRASFDDRPASGAPLGDGWRAGGSPANVEASPADDLAHIGRFQRCVDVRGQLIVALLQRLAL